ncbi:MAG: chromosome segregation protein SMC [Legionella sp.]|jgi:chromosome segregation protein
MHLKELILTGFKSFVDRTVVPFPGQLVGVVGPNGCGKSNIIDGLKWVLGESSAKNLRGESMTDVIFNGSSNRKSLGQASVELVFDNSLGRLVGPFASYGEISVKRVVTRDGESQYYLNGGRCRRKDITDIFLGTGAGARSYSIIGQGTISRIVEAKPEEIRAYLEEAAGVSKYKERRRETLLRIEHTRDNLTRVDDIRNELDKQLQRLSRQAKAAERYGELKKEEQRSRLQILALKWRNFNQEKILKQTELQSLAVRYEEQQSLKTSSAKDRTIIHEQMNELGEQSQTIQNSMYQVGTEIARLEQTIQQQEREKQRLEQEKQQIHADWQQAAQQIKEDELALEECRTSTKVMYEHHQSLKLEFEQFDLKRQEAQEQQQQWEARWQEATELFNTSKRNIELKQLNLQHAEQSQNDALLRLEKIKMEQESTSISDLEIARENLQKQQAAAQETLDFDQQELQLAHEKGAALRMQVQEAETQLHQLQDQYHQLNSEHAALVAAQKAARQSKTNKNDAIKAWADKPRLVDVLQVESTWQAVCDGILQDSLHAYILDDFDEVLPYGESKQLHGESIVLMKDASGIAQDHPRLADKVIGKVPATMPSLETIYAADDYQSAINLRAHLLDHESIVTPDGFWFGKAWAKFIISTEIDEIGLLARQKKIADVASAVQILQEKIETVRALRDQTQTQLQESVRFIELFQINLNASNEAVAKNNAALTANEQAIAHAQRQIVFLAAETEELQMQLETHTANQLELKNSLQQLERDYQQQLQQQEQGLSEKQIWLETLAQHNQKLSELRNQVHQSEITYDRELTKIQQFQDRIAREQERSRVLEQRIEQSAEQYQQFLNPKVNLQQQLEQLITQHAQVEAQLTLSREQLSQFKLQLEQLDKIILNYDLELKRIQDMIAQTRMQEQELAVRASAMQETLDESQVQAQDIVTELAEDVTINALEEELLAVSKKISALGAINLAAIEEFSSEQQRKQYLDEQYDDLNQALQTLETAIDKMDKETRTRLEATFDEVNTTFKQLFPRLFGGGRAELELTSDNLLEAGIVVMAQPPGKRNSTIHLLSGGEKAMTAVALVFAIFRLNPSPFCMLDEVDAPLDDVNVGRFCDMVKEMSQFVQFLFITHNKVTMELADHLIGVTMREPGVSRLVAVDVKQALTLE